MAGNSRPRSRVPNAPNESSKQCWEFQRHGTCKFGQRCRYSHGQERTKQGFAKRPNSQASSSDRTSDSHKARDGKLREWKRLLEGSQFSRPSPSDVGRFLQLGLDLMDGDVGASQEAIKLLASETGLLLIKDVSDQHVRYTKDKMSDGSLWLTEIRPLFRLITHPRVVDSAVLEQEVAGIYNFLLGIGCSRMERLFSYITERIPSWPSSAEASLSKWAAIELSLAVLSKMLDCNTTTIVNDKFSQLYTRFMEFSKEGSKSEDEFSRFQIAKYLDYIRQRLEIGDEIPTIQNSTKPVARETFVLRRDLPGRLSADGPRHDNDHAKISEIKILPTYDEMMSPRGEYLPTNESSQWHIQGIRGRLDREFRLVREDTVGQLRDAVRETLEHIQNSSDDHSRRSKNGARTYTYEPLTLEDVQFDRNGGLELLVCCKQPSAVHNLSLKKRRDWWIQCKRLQAGALVCILDVTGSVLFCVVSDSTKRTKDDKNAGQTTKSKEEKDDAAKTSDSFSLSENAALLYCRLQLAHTGRNEANQALRWYRRGGYSSRRCLVEFPGVLLPSFKHTLAALQQMYQKPKIPFSELIAPSDMSSPDLDVKLPQYARARGFAFDLKCLTHDNTDLFTFPQRPLNPEELASHSSLDLTQSAALLNTLSTELSLIQGPPGTGKSYTGEKIIKVLLANKRTARLGPILCVCYTNHALDQLLEHLLDDGIESIIRIGSRSKSERLQDLNLRTLVRAFDRTKSEKSRLYQVDEIIREHVREAKTLLTELSESESWRSVKKFIAESYPRQHNELFGEDIDGWQTVIHQPEKAIERWLKSGYRNGSQQRPLDDLKEAPLSSMSSDESRRLHRHWVKNIRERIIPRIVKLHDDYISSIEQRDRVRRDVDLRCLQQANIIGVTTGLARNMDLLRKLNCKVMLCEEAGEVLEAHILTALLPTVEHAILIGDHLQLRPQIQNYELQSTNPRGAQYSLDLSLFERLVQPPHTIDMKFPFTTLETQRRMHPSIAELIRTTLYPRLKDAENVMRYPGVVGMKNRLFWFQHEQLEAAAASHDPLSTSHSNDFEIEMTTVLVSHLVRQGEYSQGDIAVITPYLGQLHKLRRRMESMFEICLNDRDLADLEVLDTDSVEKPSLPKQSISKTTLLKSVRVATVDNFQGEEAKVIVISLVRSNPQNRCGFLNTSNRINVLLSRAQHGMYIIGNSVTYKDVPMWAAVIGLLQKKGNFGTEFELQCPRHPDTPLLVSQPDHFLRFSPESGCNLPCDKRLHCGHSCRGRCHSDVLHSAVKCMEACPRSKRGCSHPCPRLCGDKCHEKCIIPLKNISLALPCGHKLFSATCWEAQDPASIQCMEYVTRTIPGCTHQVQVRCFEDVSSASYRCTAECGHLHDCGHSCKSPCFQCNTRKDGKVTEQSHGICQRICSRNYTTCKHSCSKTCHSGTDCPPCTQECEVRCSHSKCSKPCHEPCAPCAEKICQSSCPHTRCTMPCAAPCNWVPCSRRCTNTLDCGHQCPSLCGEACPASAYCQQCGSEDVKSICVDFLEMKEYREINLDEEPCIFPDCGHFLTVSSMDGQMSMTDHYEMDENGFPIKINGSSEPFSMSDSGITVCATCRGSVRNLSRYGRIVRRAMLDEATKKFVKWSGEKYASLSDLLLAEQGKLEKASAFKIGQHARQEGTFTHPGSRLKQLQLLQEIVGNERYRSIISLWKKISSYAKQVRKEEQPFQRVADLVKHANFQHKTEQEFRYDEAIIQVKGSLLAMVLLLNCDIVVLSDFIGLRKGSRLVQLDTKIELSAHLRDSEQLIKLAHNTKHPKEEVQGHIFSAKLCGFSRSLGSPPPLQAPSTNGDTDSSEILRDKGLNHLSQAQSLIEKYPSTASLGYEIDGIESMLRGSTYRPVTAEELKTVYRAMAGEFRGGGHWYTCQNGHPFTIGECGMPMEQARCPECTAPIGGQNHEAAEGVRHAAEIEEIAGRVDRLGL